MPSIQPCEALLPELEMVGTWREETSIVAAVEQLKIGQQ